MITIWKSPISEHRKIIHVPDGATFLHAGMQDEVITLWYRCSTEMEKLKVQVIVAGTGHNSADTIGATYLGTVFDGPYVWHIFYKWLD